MNGVSRRNWTGLKKENKIRCGKQPQIQVRIVLKGIKLRQGNEEYVPCKRDTWVDLAMVRDSLDVEVEEEGDVQLSNWGARWRVEGVTEVHASGTQFKSGRDYWMEMMQVWTS